MPPATETRIRVRYAETDQMGVVYHANYLVWMEVGRVELCKARGFNYREMERDGVLMVVAEASCRYRSPARFDDEVRIRTWLEASNTRIATFGYEMLVEDRVIATGASRHVYVTPKLERARLPAKYHALFRIGAVD